jgi:hypothetical protein
MMDSTISAPPATRSARHIVDSHRLSPALLIFGAWVSGTLLFEISEIDRIKPRLSERRGSGPAHTSQQWFQFDHELAVSDDSIIDSIAPGVTLDNAAPRGSSATVVPRSSNIATD